MRSLAGLFGTSPFGPLQKHMEKAVACAQEVPGIVDALIEGDAEALDARQKRCAALESEADAIKNDLRGHLPRRLFMPVDRRDLLEILDLQDTIADSAEDVGDLLVMRPWIVPESMRQPMRDFAESVTACAVAGAGVMEHLDELVSSAFAGPELGRVAELIVEVEGLEDAADGAEAALRHQVFEHEDELGPVGVVLWLRLLDTMGDVADYTKKACNRLRLLIAT